MYSYSDLISLRGKHESINQEFSMTLDVPEIKERIVNLDADCDQFDAYKKETSKAFGDYIKLLKKDKSSLHVELRRREDDKKQGLGLTILKD